MESWISIVIVTVQKSENSVHHKYPLDDSAYCFKLKFSVLEPFVQFWHERSPRGIIHQRFGCDAIGASGIFSPIYKPRIQFCRRPVAMEMLSSMVKMKKHEANDDHNRPVLEKVTVDLFIMQRVLNRRRKC
jgi:hypothetical protein